MRSRLGSIADELKDYVKDTGFILVTLDSMTAPVLNKATRNKLTDSCENSAMLACDVKYRQAFEDRAMRDACDSASRRGLACDASACNAKSLAMRVERCEPKFKTHGFLAMCQLLV